MERFCDTPTVPPAVAVIPFTVFLKGDLISILSYWNPWSVSGRFNYYSADALLFIGASFS